MQDENKKIRLEIIGDHYVQVEKHPLGFFMPVKGQNGKPVLFDIVDVNDYVQEQQENSVVLQDERTPEPEIEVVPTNQEAVEVIEEETKNEAIPVTPIEEVVNKPTRLIRKMPKNIEGIITEAHEILTPFVDQNNKLNYTVLAIKPDGSGATSQYSRLSSLIKEYNKIKGTSYKAKEFISFLGYGFVAKK